MTEKTFQTEIEITGVGIHSGNPAKLTLKPASLGTGITFIRVDKNNAKIPLHPDNLEENNPRATKLSHNGVGILTPEHLLSALYASGISNLEIHIDTEEIPILDGSAETYIQKITTAGIQDQGQKTMPIVLQTEITVEENGAKILASPSDAFEIHYTLDYPDTFIGMQQASFNLKTDHYTKDIAKARTYGFRKEVDFLLSQGLAKGGTLDNAIVIEETGYSTDLYYPNELARHKILDIIGDLAVLGRPLHAKITAHKSGHSLNAKLAKKIYDSISSSL